MSGVCGGCCLRHMTLKDYQQHKVDKLRHRLQSITRQDFYFAEPIFIADGTRRRASLNFRAFRKKVSLGFNGFKSNQIIDLDNCALLTPKINSNLPFLKHLLDELCSLPIIVKNKKKSSTLYLSEGDVSITEAQNGLDIVLEFAQELNLELRMAIFEKIQQNADIIRISHRKNFSAHPETILEKVKPFIKIAGIDVFIPAGTFLQPSKQGEQSLIDTVLKYMGDTSGKIADLFCGVGTFSYPLAQNMQNKITAVDSSAELLAGFQESVNRNMIPNIEIKNKNLFKYPLDQDELKNFTAVVFDPPRAGAKEQAKQFALLPTNQRPQKIIAVSCNPESFVRDANLLLEGGYCLSQVTMIDQFTFSEHSELVALFEN